jgi:Isochorismatase family
MGVNLMVKRPCHRLLNASIVDRTSMNAWDDENFHFVIAKTECNRIVISASWIEILLVYPIISMMGAGYEAMFVADAVDVESQIAHEAEIVRVVQAGAIPNAS